MVKSAALTASLGVLLLATANTVNAQWDGVGSDSFYWHNRYHGLLSMAAYGDYNTTCRNTFTYESLQRQYPGNREQPFQVIGRWGPTQKYKSEGFMVRVPEMNKILMVFKGIYGWQNFNATLVPFEGIGCHGDCRVHAGALEAWREVQAVTNDMAVIKERQANLVWSAAGHGFGGAIMQVAALDLKSRGLLFSAHSFGSPAVFNQAAARRWDALFEGDATQRTVANQDSIPRAIPVGGNSSYAFVSTGIHVFGNSAMYGQDFHVCVGNPWDPECMGGNNEADHYFYYTDIGHCGTGWDATYDPSFNSCALASDQQRYSRTAAGPLLRTPVTSFSSVPVPTTTSTTSTSSTLTTAAQQSSGLPAAGAAGGSDGTAIAAASTSGAAGPVEKDTGSAARTDAQGALFLAAVAVGAAALGMV